MNFNRYILIALGCLVPVSNSFGADCPINVHGHNFGGYALEIIYYDCHGVRIPVIVQAGQNIELGSLGYPEGALIFNSWPKSVEGRATYLGSLNIPKEGLRFECTGVSPASEIAVWMAGKKGGCEATGNWPG